MSKGNDPKDSRGAHSSAAEEVKQKRKWCLRVDCKDNKNIKQ
jgi:hypothetical protein